MALANYLDEAIRKSESDVDWGYKIEGKDKPYKNYLSNKAWDAFLNEMSDDHKLQFEKGGGSELKEGDKTPPKMASFGSSSRFVYNLLKEEMGKEEFKKVEFEKQLPTKVGGMAHLDAYIPSDREIFIEAKRREIYVDENTYQVVYNRVGVECCPPFKMNGKKVLHFDIKQLICHFLAISASVLNGETKPNIKFIYLIFNPKDVVEHIDSKYRDEIIKQYNATLAEIELFDMKKLFEDIFAYQKTKREGSKDCPEFEFVVADQGNIKNHLK